MNKLLIVLDEESSHLLKDIPNKSENIRQAIKLYNGHILPDTAEGLRASYKIIVKSLKEIDSKLDYLDNKLDG